MLTLEDIAKHCKGDCKNCAYGKKPELPCADIKNFYLCATAKYYQSKARNGEKVNGLEALTNPKANRAYQILTTIEYYDLSIDEICRIIYEDDDYATKCDDDKKDYKAHIGKTRSQIKEVVHNIGKQSANLSIIEYISKKGTNALSKTEIEIYKDLILVWEEFDFDNKYKNFLETEIKTSDMSIETYVSKLSKQPIPTIHMLLKKYNEKCFTDKDYLDILKGAQISKEKFLRILGKTKKISNKKKQKNKPQKPREKEQKKKRN